MHWAMALTTCADGKQGSLFGPYTPLQQLDLLADYGTKSYVVGSTNSLLLQQKDRYSDILINVCDISQPAESTSSCGKRFYSLAKSRLINLLANRG